MNLLNKWCARSIMLAETDVMECQTQHEGVGRAFHACLAPENPKDQSFRL
jgi:hypothetical protein